MAMPDDVSEDLDLLRRVFPKWQSENILSYLMKTPPENRVKAAICKYIHSHDFNLNRNDCENDAKLVHEIFPDVPFTDIFRKITLFGDERNRVRICLRLLLFENGFRTSSNSDFDIDSEEIRNMVKYYSKAKDDLDSTLASLNDIRNKYDQTDQKLNNTTLNSTFFHIDSGSDSYVAIKDCNKVILSESPVEFDDPKASTSNEGLNKNQASESTETESSEFIDKTPAHRKTRTFSIDIEQLEEFFNHSDVIDFSQNLAPIEVEKITNLRVDKINVTGCKNKKKSNKITDKHVKKSAKNSRDSVICMNPFEDDMKGWQKITSNNKELIDLTGKSRKRALLPCTITSSDVIDLDTQDINSEVIVEDKRIPEPIIEKKVKLKLPGFVEIKDSEAKKVEQRIDKSIETAAGPSGVQQKRKSSVKLNRDRSPKKVKMDDLVINSDASDTSLLDMQYVELLSFDDVLPVSPPNNNINNNKDGLLMYDHLLNKKKRDSIIFHQSQESQQEDEAIEDSPDITNEENFVVDESLYFSLMEIFPEASPNFLKKMCNGVENKPEELSRITSELLDMENYPRRISNQDGEIPLEISEEDQLEILLQVLPDADPMYLKNKIEECMGDSESIKQFINDAMESKNYPTFKEYQRKQQLSTQSKQYTSEFNIDKFLEQIPDPENYFKDKQYEKLSYEERDYLLSTMKNVYNMLPIRCINQVMKVSESISGMFDELSRAADMSANRMKCRRKFVSCDTVLQNIPFLQEIAYNVHLKEIMSLLKSREKLVKQRRKEHRIAGTLETCVCCYDDGLLPEEVVQCETGCNSCKVCVQRSTEIAFGEGKTDFPCVAGCGKDFSLRLLQEALSKKLFSKVAQKRQLAEVRAAGLEDLEQCPFCDFANIPSANDRLFRCFNPECMKESCRQCKEPNHIPLRCQEVEKDADVAARTAIENRMTEALLRTCWKCNTKFIKSDGCNKMTCPKCGAFSCYVCGKSVQDYKHFNGQGGDRFDLCPLYSDTNALHKAAVLKAAEEAKKVVDPNALKHDPTADIQKHFEDYNKKNPIVLPPGVQLQEAPPPARDGINPVVAMERHVEVHIERANRMNQPQQHQNDYAQQRFGQGAYPQHRRWDDGGAGGGVQINVANIHPYVPLNRFQHFPEPRQFPRDYRNNHNNVQHNQHHYRPPNQQQHYVNPVRWAQHRPAAVTQHIQPNNNNNNNHQFQAGPPNLSNAQRQLGKMLEDLGILVANLHGND